MNIKWRIYLTYELFFNHEFIPFRDTKLYILYYEFFMKNGNQKVSTGRKTEVI